MHTNIVYEPSDVPTPVRAVVAAADLTASEIKMQARHRMPDHAAGFNNYVTSWAARLSWHRTLEKAAHTYATGDHFEDVD